MKTKMWIRPAATDPSNVKVSQSDLWENYFQNVNPQDKDPVTRAIQENAFLRLVEGGCRRPFTAS